MKKLIYTFFISLITFIGTSNAQITNPKISIQGVLREPSGVAVEDGTYDLTLKLYKQANGGTANYTENHSEVAVTNGVYSVQLGSITSLGAIAFDSLMYVGVSVGGTELLPRLELTYSPFSMAARSVMCSGAVGDVKYSILNETEFQEVNGDCWVPMDGRAIPQTTALYQKFGWSNVPDGSGLFLRAHEWNDGNDPDRTVNSPIATTQDDAFKSHSHGKGTLVTDTQTVTVNDRVLSSIARVDIVCPQVSGCGFSGTLNWNSSTPNFAVAVDSENDEEAFRVTGTTLSSSTQVSHDLTGNTADEGGTETRSKNMNFYVYIRVN